MDVRSIALDHKQKSTSVRIHMTSNYTEAGLEAQSTRQVDVQ